MCVPGACPLVETKGRSRPCCDRGHGTAARVGDRQRCGASIARSCARPGSGRVRADIRRPHGGRGARLGRRRGGGPPLPRPETTPQSHGGGTPAAAQSSTTPFGRSRRHTTRTPPAPPSASRPRAPPRPPRRTAGAGRGCGRGSGLDGAPDDGRRAPATAAERREAVRLLDRPRRPARCARAACRGRVGGVHVHPVLLEGPFGHRDEDGGPSAHPVVDRLHGDVGALRDGLQRQRRGSARDQGLFGCFDDRQRPGPRQRRFPVARWRAACRRHWAG